MSTETLPPAGDWIRGISVRQPWTTAIVARAKGWDLELTDVQEAALSIPAHGQLGPWKPTEDLVAKVRQQLPDLRP